MRRFGLRSRARVADPGGDAPRERVGEPVRRERVADLGDQRSPRLGRGRVAEVGRRQPVRHPPARLVESLPSARRRPPPDAVSPDSASRIARRSSTASESTVSASSSYQIRASWIGLLAARKCPVEPPFPGGAAAQRLVQVQLARDEPLQRVLRPLELVERRRVAEERAERQADVDGHHDRADDRDEDREARAGRGRAPARGATPSSSLMGVARGLARAIRNARIARARRRDGARAPSA